MRTTLFVFYLLLVGLSFPSFATPNDLFQEVIRTYEGKMTAQGQGKAATTTIFRQGDSIAATLGVPDDPKLTMTLANFDLENRGLLFQWKGAESSTGYVVFWFSSNYESFEGTWGWDDSYTDGGTWTGRSVLSVEEMVENDLFQNVIRAYDTYEGTLNSAGKLTHREKAGGPLTNAFEDAPAITTIFQQGDSIAATVEYPSGASLKLTLADAKFGRYPDLKNRGLLFRWKGPKRKTGLALMHLSPNYETFEGNWGWGDSYTDGGFWVGRSEPVLSEEEKRNQERLAEFSSAASSGDLSGNKLHCWGTNAHLLEQVAFKFLDDEKVEVWYIALAKTAHGYDLLNEYWTEEVVNYKVGEAYDEDVITIKTKHLWNRTGDGRVNRNPTDTIIYLSDLQVSYPTFPMCKIKESIFSIFETFAAHRNIVGYKLP